MMFFIKTINKKKPKQDDKISPCPRPDSEIEYSFFLIGFFSFRTFIEELVVIFLVINKNSFA